MNVALIETYWAIGEHLSQKISDAGWGKGAVAELATCALLRHQISGAFPLRILGG